MQFSDDVMRVHKHQRCRRIGAIVLISGITLSQFISAALRKIAPLETAQGQAERQAIEYAAGTRYLYLFKFNLVKI